MEQATYDMTDSPDSYKVGSVMGPYPTGDDRFHIRYRFVDKGPEDKRIRYVIMKGDKLYIKIPWYGRFFFRLTENRQQATLWKDINKALDWARERGLL